MLSDSESNQNASSSQSTISRSDMNNKSIDKKKDFTEEYFDSGVISDVIVSSEFSSEDVKPSVSASHISSVDLSHGIRKEVRSVMISDSGIDIESFSSDHISSRRGSLKYESAESGDTKKHILPGFTYTVEELFAQDKDGDTQLHNAIVEGCEEVVKKLIYLVPNSRFLDIQNSDLQTCLHLSVLTKQPEITRLLLLAGAQTGLEDRNGNTALHLACEGNDIACVKALLCPIFEQNWDDFKYTPQIDSPKNYINKINYEGLSCAHIAANRKHYIILHILLMNEADVNIRERKAGYTLLHEAVASGNTELVRYILQHPRINIEAQNYALYTAYQLSLMYPIISNLLLSKNAQKLKFAYEESDDEYSSDDEDDYESNDDVLDEKINALNLNHASLVC